MNTSSFTVSIDPVVAASPNADAFAAFFAGAHLGGAACLVVLALTAFFSAHVRRHALWYNYCVTWILSALAYSLLFLAGRQHGHALPSYDLCLVQAVLLYACPPLAVISLLVLTIELFFEISPSLATRTTPREKALRTGLLLALPWATFVVVLLAAFAYGYGRRATRTVTYCHVEDGVFGNVSSVLVILAFVTCIVFEVCIVRVMRRDLRAYNSVHARRGALAQSMARLGALTVLIAVSMVAAIIFIFHKDATTREFADGIIAALPFSSFVVFATQADIWHVWLCRPPQTDGGGGSGTQPMAAYAPDSEARLTAPEMRYGGGSQPF